MKFKGRLGNIYPTTPPSVPIPPEYVGAGGWASLYNDGAGVTGGEGGIIQNYTDWTTLYNDLKTNDAPTLAKTYVYTGSAFSLPDESRTISGRSNKTLYFAFGQEWTGGSFVFSNCTNIIVRNANRIHSGTTNNSDHFTFNDCFGWWVDHCTFDGLGQYPNNDIDPRIDGCIDSTRSSFGTISNCVFKDADRGILLGYSNTEFSNRGLLKITIRNCEFRNIRQRAPGARFGQIHLLENYHHWTPVWGTTVSGRPTVARDIGLNVEAQVYRQGCWFDNGDMLIEDFDDQTVKISGILNDNCYIGDYERNTTFLRSTNVSAPSTGEAFNPNTIEGYQYLVSPRTPTEAKAFVEANAGAIYHTL